MILALDIGNTHSEIGLFDEEKHQASWRIATGVDRTEDELMSFIDHFLRLQGLTPAVIDNIVISSVVPNMSQIFVKMCDKYFRMSPMMIDHRLDLGISIDYNPPSAVGADRLCNAAAAFNKYGGPCIVVDFGTGTTLDVISKEGVYLGGAICPGLETAAWGLHERASKLPKISMEFPKRVIGKNTEGSMQSGIMWGAVTMIDGLIEMMQAELETPADVIATGGLCRIIAPKSRYVHHVEPRLVLEGMIRIFLRNCKK